MEVFFGKLIELVLQFPHVRSLDLFYSFSWWRDFAGSFSQMRLATCKGKSQLYMYLLIRKNSRLMNELRFSVVHVTIIKLVNFSCSNSRIAIILNLFLHWGFWLQQKVENATKISLPELYNSVAPAKNRGSVASNTATKSPSSSVSPTNK